MKRTAFLNNKLWRDKIIAWLEETGSIVEWHMLNDQAYDKQLRIKLAEEVEEVALAQSRDHLIEELSDVLEVVDAFIELHDISLEEIRVRQSKKREEKGGFQKRHFVTVVHHPEGSIGEKYCLADPQKYPVVES